MPSDQPGIQSPSRGNNAGPLIPTRTADGMTSWIHPQEPWACHRLTARHSIAVPLTVGEHRGSIRRTAGRKRSADPISENRSRCDYENKKRTGGRFPNQAVPSTLLRPNPSRRSVNAFHCNGAGGSKFRTGMPRKEFPEVLCPRLHIRVSPGPRKKILRKTPSLYIPEYFPPCPHRGCVRSRHALYSVGQAVSLGKSASGGCRTSSSGRSLT